MIIINPGTEARGRATLANAEKIAARIVQDLGNAVSFKRHPPNHDRDGWFGFVFRNAGSSVEVSIPGDDPAEVCQGKPFVSRRLYVDGSSWLYGYALNRIAEQLGLEE